MPIKIGITGGIGSGKSVVSRLLEVMGIRVYVSDEESKRLTETDPLIRQKLTELLGNDIYRNNKLDKPALASYMFGNKQHADTVNSIIHPQVREDFGQWALNQPGEVIALESAILVEAGFRNEVDVLVMVYAPLELRIARAMKRDGCSREMILQRIGNQMDDEKKKEMADYVIVNDDTTPLIPQIRELTEKLRGSAAGGKLCSSHG